MKTITFTFNSTWHVWRNMTVENLSFLGNTSAIQITATEDSFPIVLVYIRHDGFMTYRLYYSMRSAKVAQTRLNKSGRVKTSFIYDWN